MVDAHMTAGRMLVARKRAQNSAVLGTTRVGLPVHVHCG